MSSEFNHLAFSRRHLMKSMGAFAGAGVASQLIKPSIGIADPEDPHFFIQVYVYGGFDGSCLFDARPKTFTAANKIHNYFSTDIKEWLGPNGGRCWTQSCTDSLRPFAKDFSILNGVVMSTAFDGHDQNGLSFISGNPFGGNSIVPVLGDKRAPLEYLQVGSTGFEGSLTNLRNGMSISAAGIGSIVNALNGTPLLLPAENALITAYWNGFLGNYKSSSIQARSSLAALAGMRESENLVNQIKKIKLPSSGLSSTERDMRCLLEFLRVGLTTSLLYAPEFRSDYNLDTHSASDAKNNSKAYENVSNQIAKIFKILKETEYRPGKSFFDVTTVCIGSEFGRTLRQNSTKIDETGTDHNALSNTLILGGKGIKNGCVFGGTDLDQIAGNDFVNVPKYHATYDPGFLKVMGRPIDFATGLALSENIETYDKSKFMNISNVGNTILDLFHTDDSVKWDLDRNMPKAKSLSFLLA